MPKRKRRGRSGRGKRQPGGVASKEELKAAFEEAWSKCGHPRVNPKCWRRILKQAWSDV